MLLLPIETDVSFFKASHFIPTRIENLVLPQALTRFTCNDDGAIIDMNIQLSGFSVWVHYLWLKDQKLIHPFSTKNTWALHYWMSEKIPAALKDKGNVTLADCMLFYLTAMEHSAWPAFGNSLSVHINIDPEQLPVLAGEISGLEKLAGFPYPSSSTLINPGGFVINPVTRASLHRILSSRYIGETAAIYQRRNCIDLYLQFLQQLTAVSASDLTAVVDKRICNYVRRLIAHQPEKMPPLRRIADRFDMEVDILKTGFQQNFHISLFDYAMQEKLNKAFYLVMYSGQSLSWIAKTLGYPHEAFLNGDFKLRYGKHPIELRTAQ